MKSALVILLGLAAVSAFSTGRGGDGGEAEDFKEDGMYYYYGEASKELEENAGEDREISGYGSGYSGYPSYTGYGSGYPSYTGYGSGYPSYTGYGYGYPS